MEGWGRIYDATEESWSARYLQLVAPSNGDATSSATLYASDLAADGSMRSSCGYCLHRSTVVADFSTPVSATPTPDAWWQRHALALYPVVKDARSGPATRVIAALASKSEKARWVTALRAAVHDLQWERIVPPKVGSRAYFFNRETKVSQWTRPAAASPAAETKVAMQGVEAKEAEATDAEAGEPSGLALRMPAGPPPGAPIAAAAEKHHHHHHHHHNKTKKKKEADTEEKAAHNETGAPLSAACSDGSLGLPPMVGESPSLGPAPPVAFSPFGLPKGEPGGLPTMAGMHPPTPPPASAITLKILRQRQAQNDAVGSAGRHGPRGCRRHRRLWLAGDERPHHRQDVSRRPLPSPSGLLGLDTHPITAHSLGIVPR